MKDFAGRVAVITGAASGIGFALTERAAAEDMKVVMADVEQAALDRAADALRSRGATVLASVVDVSDEAAVDRLAARAYEDLGAVHLLCNNAGVYNRPRPAWEHTVNDWKWVLDVNVWGVVYGLRAFVPRMLAGGEEGHIVNTASMAGLVTGGIGTAVYDASKHAVLSLSESLYKDLATVSTRVSASVLCPGSVTTNIFAADRNRPDELKDDSSAAAAPGSPTFPENSFPPSRMAEQVFEAVRENRFYVLAAQDEMYEWTKMGHDRMWEGRNPAVPHRLLASRREPGTTPV